MTQHDTVAEEPRTIAFPDGIPGFPRARGFVLDDLTEDGTFQLLAAADVADLSMVVASPWLFFPEYSPQLGTEDQRVLGLESEADALVFCSVTADDDEDRLYVNLLGPFVVNARTLVGRQVVLVDQDWPVRAPLPAAA